MQKSRAFNLSPDVVKSRCRAARFIARKSPARAAREMGYTNTSMISKMENPSSGTGISYQYLARAALCYGVSMDFLIGLSNYPERDPRSVEQLALYNSIQHFANNVVGELTETILKGAQYHSLEAQLILLSDDSKALVSAINKVRELNPEFDDEIRGGASLIKAAENIERRLEQIEYRLTKDIKQNNAIRQFREVLADSINQEQLDFLGFNNDNEADKTTKRKQNQK